MKWTCINCGKIHNDEFYFTSNGVILKAHCSKCDGYSKVIKWAGYETRSSKIKKHNWVSLRSRHKVDVFTGQKLKSNTQKFEVIIIL